MSQGKKVRNLQQEILHKNKNTLLRTRAERQDSSGGWKEMEREVYYTRDAATALLFHRENRTVILIRQFRMPTYLNKNPDGELLEICAGKIEDESAESCIRRELKEETGYEVERLHKIFEAYMSPGALMELVHFFLAPYTQEMKVGRGGGLEEEGEDIDLIELPFDKAYAMIGTNEIKDAKTIIMLQYLKLNESHFFKEI